MTQLGISYIGNRIVRHAREDLKKIAACSDYVIHTLNEADLTYHKSVMSKILAESRKCNLDVWIDPWGLGGVFGGESFSKFLIEHRDSWQVMSDGRIVPSACLNRPEWMSYMKEWILSIRDMGGQAIFWDEPHIAFDMDSELDGIYSCTCSVCQDLFRKRFGEPMPKTLTDSARQFRRETIKNFLSQVMEYAKTKHMKNILCLYAFKGIKEYDLVWQEAAQLKDLDNFGCDPYWRWHGKRMSPVTHVGEFADYVVSTARKNNKESHVWIQAMRLPSGAEDEIDLACQAAVKAGVTHVAAWSYDGGELLDPVLSEDPDRVWRSIEKAFMRIRNSR